MPVLSPARALVVCALAILGTACDKDAFEGAFLGLDDKLLILIDADGTVLFKSVLDDGICSTVGDATYENDELVFTSGDPIPVRAEKDSITLTDPEALLSGAYARVDPKAVCFAIAPDPGPMIAGAFEVTPGASRSIGGGARARSAQISIGANVGTLAIYLIGQDVDWDQIQPRALVSPSRRSLLSEEEYLAECGTSFCSVLLPKIPGFAPETGTYVFEFGGVGDIDDVRVLVVTRAGPISNTTVHMHVVLGPTDHQKAEIDAALAGVVSFLGGVGITVVIDPVVTRTDTAFASIPATFLSTPTKAIMALGDPDAINVFLVDDITGIEGLYGISSGIPGSLGVVGPWNGVLVNITTHEQDTSVPFAQLVRETIVHEVGHQIGLYHPTESDGTFFDPLDDTPECPAATFDADMDGELLADECESAGGDNVMFWTPGVSLPPLVPQTVLTPDQRFVYDRVVVGQ